MQDLRKSSLLVYANKQDVRGAMTAAEISQQLGLTRIKDHTWHIQACCALTGEGFVFIYLTSKVHALQRSIPMPGKTPLRLPVGGGAGSHI